MKSLIIAAVLALIVTSGSIAYTCKIDEVSVEMAQINDVIASNLEHDDFNAAETKIADLKGYIEKKRTIMEAMGNHQDLDEIRITVFELEKYTEGRSRTDALSKCAVLGFLFEHLPESYHVKAENIL